MASVVEPSAVYQTIILALFTALALFAGHRVGAGQAASAGQRANTAAVANLFAAPFGLLLPIPALIHADSGVTASVMAVSVAIIALAIRRFLGRTWAITPYGIALWTTLLAIPQARSSEADLGLYALIGVSLPVALLLVIAALATVAALWENVPAAMIAPAAIAWLALFGRIDPLPALIVALAIFAREQPRSISSVGAAGIFPGWSRARSARSGRSTRSAFPIPVDPTIR